MSVCSPRRDFLRQIVNRVISESSGKIPVNVIEDIKVKFARAEDKYGFSIFGGNPAKLHDFLSSEDWAEIVEYARTINATWLLEAILRRLAEDYREDCPSVASKALEAIEALGKGKPVIGEELTLESITRRLKFYGLKFEVKREGDREYIEVEQPLVKLRIQVSQGSINYTICKEGKASTLEAVLTVLQKIREI